jgi:hypothetical protein
MIESKRFALAAAVLLASVADVFRIVLSWSHQQHLSWWHHQHRSWSLRLLQSSWRLVRQSWSAAAFASISLLARLVEPYRALALSDGCPVARVCRRMLARLFPSLAEPLEGFPRLAPPWPPTPVRPGHSL